MKRQLPPEDGKMYVYLFTHLHFIAKITKKKHINKNKPIDIWFLAHLAHLSKSSRRAIVVTLALVAASTLAARFDVLVEVFFLAHLS